MRSHSHPALGAIVFLFVLALSNCSTEVRDGTGGAATSGIGGAGTGGKALDGGECRDSDDCADTDQECYAPGEDPGPAPCSDDSAIPCNSDADCQLVGDGMFCDANTNGICPACMPGCGADADCGTGEVCLSDHTCKKGCQVDADCGPNMECDTNDEPHCAPTHCSSDADCAGYCVYQRCYGAPGTCQDIPY